VDPEDPVSETLLPEDGAPPDSEVTATPTRRRRLFDALDERLGLQGLQYPIPEHANKLAYSLGGLTLITFVLMVATGVYLTQYYNPDPRLAHESVRHIITGVTLGTFVRALHYWGAMAMIVLVGLHLLRVFVSGSFKRPREGNWIVGVGLAAITAMLFFSGTVLKWDQESLEALEHNIEIGRGFGNLEGQVWRIGLMGYGSSEENVLALLYALETQLAKQKFGLERGAGVAAAARYLSTDSGTE